MKNLLYFAVFYLIFSFSVNAEVKGKVYQSFDSENNGEIIVVPAEVDGHYYVNYKGFGHEFDKQTMLYEKIKADIGDGYRFKMVGTPFVNIKQDYYKTLINGTLVTYLNVFLPNDFKSKVVYVYDADITMARKVKESYHKRQLDVGSRVQASDYVNKSKKSLFEKCSNDVIVNVDWDAFKTKKSKPAPAKLSTYFKSLIKICAIDEDYLDAVREIKTINVIPSELAKKQRVDLNGTELTIHIATEQPNLPETSYQAIFDVL